MDVNLTLSLPRQKLKGCSIFTEIKLPATATPYSVGHDFIMPQNVTCHPHTTIEAPTGIKLELPNHLWMELHIRSSLALKGLTLENAVVDPDFRGEIVAIIRNFSSNTIEIPKGDRFCQKV